MHFISQGMHHSETMSREEALLKLAMDEEEVGEAEEDEDEEEADEVDADEDEDE